MKKRIISMCLMALMLVSMLAPAAQAEYLPEKVITTVTALGNGITVESTVIIHESISAFSTTETKKATKTDTYKQNGTQIATVSITASFGYDGSSSWVNSASVSKSISSDWTYSNEKMTTSGGTATVTAILSKIGVASLDVYTYISCSPDGEIS
ncbi:MAG: hypothetical protein NC319_08595 [Butyricicoccus sp.]|nr:hypothetical protein [Butyricicoccus sp.]